MQLRPFMCFITGIMKLVACKYQFPKQRIGEQIVVEGKGSFIVFMHMIHRQDQTTPFPSAEFVVWFRPVNVYFWTSFLFSLITIPLLAGIPGFYSKLWYIDINTGFCMGVYKWQTKNDAERYSESFALRFMAQHSIPGSVSCRINSIAQD